MIIFVFVEAANQQRSVHERRHGQETMSCLVFPQFRSFSLNIFSIWSPQTFFFQKMKSRKFDIIEDLEENSQMNLRTIPKNTYQDYFQR